MTVDHARHLRANRHDLDAAKLLRWHWEKAGTIEHVYDVVKNELGGRNLPSGRFGANAAWFCFAPQLARANRESLCGSADEAKGSEDRGPPDLFSAFGPRARVRDGLRTPRETLLRLVGRFWSLSPSCDHALTARRGPESSTATEFRPSERRNDVPEAPKSVRQASVTRRRSPSRRSVMSL